MTLIAEIQKRHSEFVEMMNWRGMKSPLEATALICKEIGELTHELRQNKIDLEKVGAKLAGIILRTIDLAIELEVDIEQALTSKVNENFKNIDSISRKVEDCNQKILNGRFAVGPNNNI